MKTPHIHRRAFFVVAAAASLLSACVPSLHPFYTESDLVKEPRIHGRWEQNGSAWIFEPSKGMELKVSLIDNGKDGKKHGRFVGRLFKLKGHLFLVAGELELAPELSDVVKASLIPGHLLLLVGTIEPELQLTFCDGGWLDKYLEANPSTLAHLRTQGHLALTADTRSLQAFVLAHLGDGELFGHAADRKDDVFERAKVAPPPQPKS